MQLNVNESLCISSIQKIYICFQLTWEMKKIWNDSPHKFKLAIWWNEADAVLSLKLTEFNTLVKLAVINGNRTLSTGCSKHNK